MYRRNTFSGHLKFAPMRLTWQNRLAVHVLHVNHTLKPQNSFFRSARQLRNLKNLIDILKPGLHALHVMGHLLYFWNPANDLLDHWHLHLHFLVADLGIWYDAVNYRPSELRLLMHFHVFNARDLFNRTPRQLHNFWDVNRLFDNLLYVVHRHMHFLVDLSRNRDGDIQDILKNLDRSVIFFFENHLVRAGLVALWRMARVVDIPRADELGIVALAGLRERLVVGRRAVR
mmetsp:Transcript_52554/g.115263  ORF Transcript_52554/g.115263 Transcript_52554/m.115263 type:complete len:230 (-) Transcript_52554:275-964(-)